VQAIEIEDKLLDYLLALVQRTRQHPDLALGASPRAAVAWLQTSKAHAWLEGRNYATPDDVKQWHPLCYVTV
jgi:MoxR-like ATPase